MSWKSTKALTKDDEHWYVDGNAPANQGANTQRCIVLEFDGKHRVDNYDDGSFEVIIEEGSALFEMLSSTAFSKKGQYQ